jgi:Putative peptidoglycan binding domain
MAEFHIVKQGECLCSIAHHYGFTDWRVIYNDPHNAAFKAKRPNPNLIYPGDELYIPDRQPRYENGQTDNRHRFKVHPLPTYLNVCLQDPAKQPLAHVRFHLRIETLEFEGNTDGHGWVRQEIPASAELGNLTVWPSADSPDARVKWEVKLGHLDPLETTTGVKARLRNLQYYSGEVNDVEDDVYKAAVRRFQQDNGLAVDGIVGPHTRNKLKEEHRV